MSQVSELAACNDQAFGRDSYHKLHTLKQKYTCQSVAPNHKQDPNRLVLLGDTAGMQRDIDRTLSKGVSLSAPASNKSNRL